VGAHTSKSTGQRIRLYQAPDTAASAILHGRSICMSRFIYQGEHTCKQNVIAIHRDLNQYFKGRIPDE